MTIDQHENDVIATVRDLIEHLKKFKPEQKLCFWDEGGAYWNCEHVTKDMLGTFMFVSVEDQKTQRIKSSLEQNSNINKSAQLSDVKNVVDIVNDDYEFVNNDDVVVF